MSFTITNLVGNRALVTGTDVFGETSKQVFDSTQYLHLAAQDAALVAGAGMDAKIAEFFAPLTEAADAYNDAVSVPENDDAELFEIVLEEGSPAVAATPRKAIKLEFGTVVLNMIEAGDFDRLIWVDGSLQILAKEKQVSIPEPVEITSVEFEMRPRVETLGVDGYDDEA